jgi:hypothetical protein
MWFWILVLVTYALTLLLEWPFIAWRFRGAQDWLKRSVRASFVVQSSSYILLFGWYWMASSTSLYTKTQVVAPEDLFMPESVLVYFIGSSDGNVYRRSLAGGDGQKIYELRSTHKNDRLFVRSSAEDTNRWDLMARLETGDHRNPRFVEVLTMLHILAAPDWRSAPADPPEYKGTGFNFGRVQVLGSATHSPWEFWVGFWPVEGLRASEKETGHRERFSYETPFGAWSATLCICPPTKSYSNWVTTRFADSIRWNVEWLCFGTGGDRCQ